MSAISINTSRTDTTMRRAIIDGTELQRIVAKLVAADVVVDPGVERVRINCNLSHRMRDDRSINEASVTITVDHGNRPGAVEVEL
ncbi:MAG: hypothetical protein QOJ04_3514 [Caballeronia sp.]|nr:hypothetical protein [Caballeronia sp.]